MMGFLRFALQCPRLFVRFALCFMVAAFPVFASAEEPAHISGEIRLAVESLLPAQQSAISGHALDPQGPSAATKEKADTPQLSGTIVDPSGAVIAGATVEIRNSDGTVQRTTASDSNGYFSMSGLPAGNYQLFVSSTGFETKQMPITIGSAEEVPLRISLAVSIV